MKHVFACVELAARRRPAHRRGPRRLGPDGQRRRRHHRERAGPGRLAGARHGSGRRHRGRGLVPPQMKPYSSYEVLVDGLTGGLATVPVVTQESSSGSTSGAGPVFAWDLAPRGRLRRRPVAAMMELLGGAHDDLWIRVSGPHAHGGARRAVPHPPLRHDARAVPLQQRRDQVTILIMQNTSDRPVYFNATFFDSNGAWLGGLPRSNPMAWPFSTRARSERRAGKSGSIRLNHDGRYGDLTGKAVSLEPRRASPSTR